jgi:hypothetical protein
MPLPVPRPLQDHVLIATGIFTFTAGGTIAIASPYRGEIVAVYGAPADGGALGGASATLTVSVANSSVGVLTLGAVSAGAATGGDTAFSPRALVNAGDVIKLVLGTNLTNANNANFAVVIRERTA